MQILRPVVSVLLCLAWASMGARAEPVWGTQRPQRPGRSPLEGTWLPLSAEGWNRSLLPFSPAPPWRRSPRLMLPFL